MSRHRALVGVGSNLGDRIANVDRAIAAIGGLGTVAANSSLYRTQPWGYSEQPWFLNAVVAIETDLAPLVLLARLQEIEVSLGRVRTERWGPRSIDLDLLLYDDLEMATPELRIPHPRLRDRAFVLVPLTEIDERFRPLRDALKASERAGVVRVDRESVAAMSEEPTRSASARVRALAQFLASGDAVRVRIERGDDEIEISARPRIMSPHSRSIGRASGEAPAQRIDTIKADLVGIFRVSRPAPQEDDAFDGDRELGFIEALGIRTPVHSMGAGRLVSVATADGAAVEYGQPLFFVARGK